MILVGAYAISGQILFIRELLVLFYGNELCIGIIFFCWFLGIAVGAGLSGRLTRRYANIWNIFFTSLIILTLLPFVLIPVVRLLRTILAVLPGEHFTIVDMLSGAGISVWPFGFMIGFFFPVACKILVSRGASGSSGIGLVYVWESAGSLAGGIIISLVLLPLYRPLQIFSAHAFLIWVAALCYVLVLKTEISQKAFTVGFLALAGTTGILMISGGVLKMEEYLINLRWRTFNNELHLVASHDSRYQNIVIARDGEQYNIFTDGQFIGSYPDEYQAALKAHLMLCQHPSPKRVLIIGGGLTGVIRNILQYPVKSIDYLELDAEMVKMLLPVISPADRKILDDSRVRVIYEDGRRFVKNSSNKYDLILVNTPEPATAALNRFYTKEFLQEAKRILSNDGILAIGITASATYLGDILSPYAGSLYKSLQQIFPLILVLPQEDTCYFLAALQQNLLTEDAAVLAERYRSRSIYSSSFSAEVFKVLVQKERIEFVTNALRSQTEVPTNTDFKPITYFYNMQLWERVTAGKGGLILFKYLKENFVVWFFLLAGIFCFARLAWILKKKSKKILLFNSLWAIGTTGCAGMALEIVLIFTFQNMYGYVYQMIGVIVGSFMLGLTLGGCWINQKIKQANWQELRLLVICEILLFIYSIILPFLLNSLNAPGTVILEQKIAAWVPYLYMVLVFATGFITGLEFPLVSHILIGKGHDSGAVSGWVDATDHLGACAGSLFTGTILMPLVGVYETCFIVGLLKVSSCSFLLLQNLKNKK